MTAWRPTSIKYPPHLLEDTPLDWHAQFKFPAIMRPEESLVTSLNLLASRPCFWSGWIANRENATLLRSPRAMDRISVVIRVHIKGQMRIVGPTDDLSAFPLPWITAPWFTLKNSILSLQEAVQQVVEPPWPIFTVWLVVGCVVAGRCNGLCSFCGSLNPVHKFLDNVWTIKYSQLAALAILDWRMS
jgi:hypothetical protein